MIASYLDWDSAEKWKVAFIVNVSQELGSDGTTSALTVDWDCAFLP